MDNYLRENPFKIRTNLKTNLSGDSNCLLLLDFHWQQHNYVSQSFLAKNGEQSLQLGLKCKRHDQIVKNLKKKTLLISGEQIILVLHNKIWEQA